LQTGVSQKLNVVFGDRLAKHWDTRQAFPGSYFYRRKFKEVDRVTISQEVELVKDQETLK